ncbi:peroxiredoxin [Oceanimonas sp. NS1]|uniref:Glutathione-dependent peroxiredoxin n=1 Tax=Oceanimonas doudoroffii TaxID=84158 RepID=A0A233RFS5_9GAMM|nr:MULTISPECIES: peroxiredoxin [Oceanimonas]MCT7656086.1 peroxiredoxin [Oceanimonas sp. NS1]NHI01767.1 putative peroxiredoxin [Oceanimonas sp. MB9]OXY82253.1 peroxiredoxin [Oceanimonas doudoroffii]
MIKPGDTLPQHDFTFITESGKANADTHNLFGNKKAVIFAVPGAFTPTCSQAHLPGFVALEDEFQTKGVELFCLSVNDAFVMHAWQQSQNAGAITMLADGDGAFTRALGLAKDTGAFGGLRAQRFALVVDDGVVTQVCVEAPGQFEVSSAEAMLQLV